MRRRKEGGIVTNGAGREGRINGEGRAKGGRAGVGGWLPACQGRSGLGLGLRLPLLLGPPAAGPGLGRLHGGALLRPPLLDLGLTVSVLVHRKELSIRQHPPALRILALLRRALRPRRLVGLWPCCPLLRRWGRRGLVSGRRHRGRLLLRLLRLLLRFRAGLLRPRLALVRPSIP